jgi:hypothetical protein
MLNTLERLLGMTSNKKINKELNEIIENKFLTSAKFSSEIETIVSQEKVNYIDAIVMFCEKNDLEIDSVTKLVSKSLKEKLKHDAIELNFIKKTSQAKLPI